MNAVCMHHVKTMGLVSTMKDPIHAAARGDGVEGSVKRVMHNIPVSL
jgi:hypothetical protein